MANPRPTPLTRDAAGRFTRVEAPEHQPIKLDPKQLTAAKIKRLLESLDMVRDVFETEIGGDHSWTLGIDQLLGRITNKGFDLRLIDRPSELPHVAKLRRRRRGSPAPTATPAGDVNIGWEYEEGNRLAQQMRVIEKNRAPRAGHSKVFYRALEELGLANPNVVEVRERAPRPTFPSDMTVEVRERVPRPTARTNPSDVVRPFDALDELNGLRKIKP